MPIAPVLAHLLYNHTCYCLNHSRPKAYKKVDKPMTFAKTKSINMAKAIVVIQLLILAFMSATGNQGSANAHKTWCVAKPSSGPEELLKNIHYACNELQCSIIQEGGPCFLPDTMINHASVVMNLYYQSKGRNYWNCDFSKSALTVTTDPSYGSCIYA